MHGYIGLTKSRAGLVWARSPPKSCLPLPFGVVLANRQELKSATAVAAASGSAAPAKAAKDSDGSDEEEDEEDEEDDEEDASDDEVDKVSAEEAAKQFEREKKVRQALRWVHLGGAAVGKFYGRRLRDTRAPVAQKVASLDKNRSETETAAAGPCAGVDI